MLSAAAVAAGRPLTHAIIPPTAGADCSSSSTRALLTFHFLRLKWIIVFDSLYLAMPSRESGFYPGKMERWSCCLLYITYLCKRSCYWRGVLLSKQNSAIDLHEHIVDYRVISSERRKYHNKSPHTHCKIFFIRIVNSFDEGERVFIFWSSNILYSMSLTVGCSSRNC